MKSYEFDISQWPIVVITLRGAMTNEECDAYLARLTELATKRQRWAAVLDCTEQATLNREQKQKVGAFFKTNQAVLNKYCAGMAWVFSMVIQRFIMSSIMLAQKLPFPYKMAALKQQGLSWCSEQLAQEGKASVA